jgi:hypothetical protein
MAGKYLERQMTECFWQTECHGVFVQEYALTKKGIDCARRCADAVILPDEDHRRATFADFPSLTGRNVVVVQTKAQRLGMYLMGQAIFSARLVQALGARSVRSILLCAENDAALLPLLGPFHEIEVWVTDKLAPQSCAESIKPVGFVLAAERRSALSCS